MESDDTLPRPDADDAQTALRLAADAETRIRSMVPSPRWYAPLYGVVVALLPAYTALLGAGHAIVAWALMLLYVASLGALVGAYRRLSGVWPRRAGRVTTLMMVGMATLLLVALATAFAATRWWDLPWLAVAVVAGTGVGTGVASRAYDRAWKASHS